MKMMEEVRMMALLLGASAIAIMAILVMGIIVVPVLVPVGLGE